MLKNILVFLCGAGLGAGAAYVVLKEKFNSEIDSRVQEEIDEYKAYKKEQEEQTDEESETKVVPEVMVNTDEKSKEAARISLNKPSIEDIVKNKAIIENYTTYSKVDSTPVQEEGANNMKKVDEAPYAIIDTRFNEENQYYKETLNYYDIDGVLTDMSDNPLNLDEYIGEEALEHIGDQYDDVVYVRNESKNTDYEVCVIHDSFESVVGKDDDYEED